MKTTIYLLAAIVIASLALSGCGLSRKASEKAAEKAIESQTGAKVDIDSKKGDVTIKTEEGESSYSAGGNLSLPEGFPQELILADDAKINISSAVGAGKTVGYLTDLEQEKIFSDYLSRLADQGWEKEMELDTGSGKMLNFNKGKEKVSINISESNAGEDSGRTLVYLIYLPEEIADIP